ncbi:hypothetical protein IAU60_002384 [Kwoniella sp. DSM 27419]
MSWTNVTVDDPSPLIIYSGDWDGSAHTGDPFVNRYSNSTFHASKSFGDSASFDWQGGQIWLFGAKRLNHGPYGVVLDTSDKVFASGQGADTFGQVLYASGELDEGSHHIVLSNEQGRNGSDLTLGWLDLDYIVYETLDVGGSAAFITTGTPKIQVIFPTGPAQTRTISSAAPSLGHPDTSMAGLYLGLFVYTVIFRWLP